jgi:hypothetical protein
MNRRASLALIKRPVTGRLPVEGEEVGVRCGAQEEVGLRARALLAAPEVVRAERQPCRLDRPRDAPPSAGR